MRALAGFLRFLTSAYKSWKMEGQNEWMCKIVGSSIEKRSISSETKLGLARPEKGNAFMREEGGRSRVRNPRRLLISHILSVWQDEEKNKEIIPRRKRAITLFAVREKKITNVWYLWKVEGKQELRFSNENISMSWETTCCVQKEERKREGVGAERAQERRGGKRGDFSHTQRFSLFPCVAHIQQKSGRWEKRANRVATECLDGCEVV